MPNARVKYCHWTDEIAPPRAGEKNEERTSQIANEVHAALEKLAPNERLMIERYYLQFEEMLAIADSLGITESRAWTIHARAVRRLRKVLAPFVRQQFGIRKTKPTRCPICRSSYRAQIDELIRTRDPRRPWRFLLQRLRSEFGLRIRAYQTIESHERFH